jgi:predicted transcriptional regulator
MTIEVQSLTKTAAISARALPEERRALDLIARQDRRRPSEVVRELIRAEATRRGFWPNYTNREV